MTADFYLVLSQTRHLPRASSEPHHSVYHYADTVGWSIVVLNS